MTRRAGLAGVGAAAVLLVTGCGGSDTPADDIEPQDTLQSDNTVGTEDDSTDGPTGSPSE